MIPAGTSLHVVRTDCLAALYGWLAGRVDVLLCNPPYVATADEETGSTGTAAAWAGGSRAGRGLTDRVIAACPALLSRTAGRAGGRCYLVAEECNRPGEVAAFARGLGLKCAEVLKRRCGREMLYVLRIERSEARVVSTPSPFESNCLPLPESELT